MQRRKTVFSIVLAVLALILSVAMLVACNNDKPKYTITFDDGSGATTTITVEEGSSLTAEQIPADVSKLGHKFLGWYNGETKFESNMTFKADTTFVAKYERTGYVVTISFAPADKEDIHVVVPLEGGTLPEGFIPETAPAVEDKAFRGYFNGNVEAAVGLPITEDVTFSAQYYGAEIYTGVFVNEESKLVAILDDDYFYLGTDYIARENLTFNTQTGAMEYPKEQFKTGWTFSLVDGELSVTKIASETTNYTLAEVTDSVDFEGTYAQGQSSSLTVIKGGFVMVGGTPTHQYMKITATNDGYVLTAVKSADSEAETANVTIDKNGHLTISDIAKGIWLKNAKYERSIAGQITQFSVDGESIYVYNSNGETQIVTADKDIVETDGYIVAFTLKDDSKVVIRVNVRKNPNTDKDETSYTVADSLRGTYTAGTQTLDFDGFGKVVATSTDENGHNGTYSYTYKSNEPIMVGNLFKVIFSGDSFEIINKDKYVGTYKVLGVSSATTTTIMLDGFGIVKTSKAGEASTGTYTVVGDKLTITATVNKNDDSSSGEPVESSFNGEYTMLYDGTTLTKDDTYWCKEGGEDKFNELRGKWIEEDGEKTLVIDVGAGIISVEFDGNAISNIKVLKADRSVLVFSRNGSKHTITVGDTEGTLTLTVGESNKTTYVPKISVDEAFLGTWSNNDDEAIKVVVEDEDTVQVDFDETDGANDLVTATLISADETSITIAVDGKTYTITITGNQLTVTSDEMNTVQLQKHTIADKYVGEWKATNEADGTWNLVITGRKVTLNGVDAVNIQPGTGANLKFTVGDVDYTFWSFGELDYNDNDKDIEIYMSKDNSSSGGSSDDIITNSEFFKTWTWNDNSMDPASGTIVISANSVTINDVAVTDLVEEDSNNYFEITFTYQGKNYIVYKQYSFSSLKIQLQEGQYPETALSEK